jgi:hypothetical protein
MSGQVSASLLTWNAKDLRLPSSPREENTFHCIHQLMPVDQMLRGIPSQMDLLVYLGRYF